MKNLRSLLCALTCGFLVLPAIAHKGSDAYLEVRSVSARSPSPAPSGLQYTLSVAIKDLDSLLPVDANADGRVTWGEVKSSGPDVLAMLQTTARLDAVGTECGLRWNFDGLEQRGDGSYFRAVAQSPCASPEPPRFQYTLFRDQDSTHRLIITGRVGEHDLLLTASPQQRESIVLGHGELAPGQRPWTTLWAYLTLGLHHLLEGYDHLAFLLALVLPLRLSLWPRQGLEAYGIPALLAQSAGPPVWWPLLRTITAFTLGHSITLMFATFGWTEASPTWVEPVIALSIAVTALLNLYPLRWLRTEALALGFGLVHGFGFAGLLLEAAAPSGLLPWALAGFNLGVEAGQLLAVAGWVLVVQLAVRRPWYSVVVVRGGSVLLILLALVWFVERLR
jgi:hypothetical protein